MKVVILGAAGMQARAIYQDLLVQDDVEAIHLVDLSFPQLTALSNEFPHNGKIVQVHAADLRNVSSVATIMGWCDVAISCAPYDFNYALAVQAIDSKCSFVDLGGNNDIVRLQLELSHKASEAGVLIVPDCGLAPGVPSILTAQVVRDFDTVDTVEILCGGLPQPKYRDGYLDYSLVFSVQGLINEYTEDAMTIVDGKKVQIPSLLGDVEPFGHDNLELEAAVTSGGISTLPDTFESEIKNLGYKTLRYPGHWNTFKLLKQLGVFSVSSLRPIFERQLKAILDKKLPDMVVFALRADGHTDGKFCYRDFYFRFDQPNDDTTAMAAATGWSASIVALMIGRGQTIIECGAIPQEICVDPELFIEEYAARGINIEVTDNDS